MKFSKKSQHFKEKTQYLMNTLYINFDPLNFWMFSILQDDEGNVSKWVIEGKSNLQKCYSSKNQEERKEISSTFATGRSLNIGILCFFFSKNFHYFATSPLPALGFYWLDRKRSQPGLPFYMQGMGCSELGNNTILNEHPAYDSDSFSSSLEV